MPVKGVNFTSELLLSLMCFLNARNIGLPFGRFSLDSAGIFLNGKRGLKSNPFSGNADPCFRESHTRAVCVIALH